MSLTKHKAPVATLPKLTETTLTQALLSEPQASVLVIGKNLRREADLILRRHDGHGEPTGELHGALRIHVDPDRDPAGWEVF